MKAIFADEGVDDWTAWYDPELTVDEHREVAARAATGGAGKRLIDDALDTKDCAEQASAVINVIGREHGKGR